MTPEQIEAKRARWRKWYAEHRSYRRSHAPKYTQDCQYCEKEFTSSKPAKFCSRDCRTATWRTGGVRLITAARVRAEEGLDKPKTPHVCHFYAPSYRCLCGKQGDVPAREYRRVIFQPAVMQAGD